MNVICFGDSITQAPDQAEGDRWPTCLQTLLNEWRPGTFRVYNRGIASHTSAMGLDRMEADVLPLLPAVVLVEFGLNDAHVREWMSVARVGLEEYRRNLTEIYRVVHDRKGRCVFILNHSTQSVNFKQGNAKTFEQNLDPYNKAALKLARKLKAPYIDIPKIMAAHQVDLKRFLSEDGIHLSAEGNHIYANMVFGILAEVLKDGEKA